MRTRIFNVFKYKHFLRFRSGLVQEQINLIFKNQNPDFPKIKKFLFWKIKKSHFQKSFNDPQHKPAGFINYKALKHLLKRNAKIAFGIKMYIPVLRGKSYVLPTRLLPTAFYTEGHFSNATLAQIQKFWRQYRG